MCIRDRIQAVKQGNYQEELEYNGDDNIDVTMRACNGRINHLICLGKGELANRIVVHLYAQLDGTVGTKPVSYTHLTTSFFFIFVFLSLSPAKIFCNATFI